MATKLLTFFITFASSIVIGTGLFFFLLLALNGYNGADGEWGIYTYIGLAFVVTVVCSLLSVLLVNYLVKRKQKTGIIAGLIATPIFVILGAALNFVAVVIGIIVAEVVRTNF
ncbi:MAG: hypothetical protein ABIP78_10180 [Pyrinomonadaceae bacterium]